MEQRHDGLVVSQFGEIHCNVVTTILHDDLLLVGVENEMHELDGPGDEFLGDETDSSRIGVAQLEEIVLLVLGGISNPKWASKTHLIISSRLTYYTFYSNQIVCSTTLALTKRACVVSRACVISAIISKNGTKRTRSNIRGNSCIIYICCRIFSSYHLPCVIAHTALSKNI